MKLQKLVYFTHGWWLAINGTRLLAEPPQVWKHGPVFPSLYHNLKTFGHLPIRDPQSEYPNQEPPLVSNRDNYVPGYIEFVWNKYGHLTSYALSDLTHKPGSAWRRVASEHNFSVPPGLYIPDAYVKDEFDLMYAEERAHYEQAAAG